MKPKKKSIPKKKIEQISLDSAQSITVSSTFQASKKNTTSIWQGMSHKWEHLPHRMGDFANYIKDSAVKDTGQIEITSKACCTFKPGQDGDEGEIITFYRPIHQPNIGVKRGYWVEKFTDRPDLSRKDDRAVYTSTEARDISTEISDLNYGNYDNYAVVLRGFDINMTNTKTGESGYIWPTHFKIEILSATLNSAKTSLDCSIRIEVTREDSPDIKNAKDPIEYDVKIYFTAIGGDGQDFQTAGENTFSVKDKNYEEGAKILNKEVIMHPSVKKAVTGITGISFDIEGDKLYKDRDGRYLKFFELYVEDEPIDGNGRKEINARLGIHTTKSVTANAALYSATIKTVQLAFKSDARGLDLTKRAYMNVCSDAGAALHNCTANKTSDEQEVIHSI